MWIEPGEFFLLVRVKSLGRNPADAYSLHKILMICGMVGIRHLRRIIAPGALGALTAQAPPCPDLVELWTVCFREAGRMKTTAFRRVCDNAAAQLVALSTSSGAVEFVESDE